MQGMWARSKLVAAAGILAAFGCCSRMGLLAAGAQGEVAGADPQKLAALLSNYRPPAAVTAATGVARDKLHLGQQLFFDPILSRHEAESCATCHNPGLSWAAGLPRAIGDNGVPMDLRAPTLIDIDGLPRYGWDGKFASMEAVTFAAISGARNMNLSVPEALARLHALPGYATTFDTIYPGQGITRATVEDAVATFERSIVSQPSPFDRWVAGDDTRVSPAAKRGFLLFNGQGRCAECHSGWAFTDGSFHDIGVAQGKDIGRGALFPTSRKLRYAFKTPTLRDVAHRAPYMHDGSVPTLDAVIELYDRGGIDRPSRAEIIRPLHLTASDKSDLIAFLHTLTEDPSSGAPTSPNFTATNVPVLPR